MLRFNHVKLVSKNTEYTQKSIRKGAFFIPKIQKGATMQLLFFHANYCPPCKQMQPVAEQYAAQTGIPLYTFRSDDVYGGNAMARQHHVKRLPCLILLDDDGREQARTEAVQTLEGLRKVFESSES
ncbi:MAG: thioredoxin family protein [Ruminococcus callidus]|nr:thioredoxin family protein [Ruminococcus sp.]MDY6145621.1 thioredoxin family protein [Ruminococcus callidus]